MRGIDRLHLEYPFVGSPMLRDLLCQDGHDVGRKHVGTLMLTRCATQWAKRSAELTNHISL